MEQKAKPTYDELMAERNEAQEKVHRLTSELGRTEERLQDNAERIAELWRQLMQVRDESEAATADVAPGHAGPKNLHEAIAIGIERALRDFGVDLVGCAPSTLTGHVVQELKRIPGWRQPLREIETPEELDALPVGAIVLDFFAAGCTRVHPDPLFGWVRATSAHPDRKQVRPPYLPATVLHEPDSLVDVPGTSGEVQR